VDEWRDERKVYFSLNVLARSHVMMGRFLRSLYVGRRTVYLSPEEACLLCVDIVKGMS